MLPAPDALAAWRSDTGAELVASLRNRFVTGDWAEGQRRSEARPQGEGGEGGSGDEDGDGDSDQDSDDAVFGDFEDLETGQRFGADGGGDGGGGGDAVAAAAARAIEDAKKEAERLKAIKRAKKATFDAKYDTKDGKGVDEEDGEGGGAGGSGEGSEGEEADGEGEGKKKKGFGEWGQEGVQGGQRSCLQPLSALPRWVWACSSGAAALLWAVPRVLPHRHHNRLSKWPHQNAAEPGIPDGMNNN